MAGFDFDVLIIGSGPGGYVAGIRAGQLGLKAAVIERDKVGGVCLNVGCIPSKTLIHQAELFRSLPALKEMGLAIDLKGFDYSPVFDKSRKAADTLSKGVQFLLKKNKVELINGDAALSGKNEVTLKDGKKITGKNIVIATGSRPRIIPGFEFDEQKVLSSTGALMLKRLPGKAIILGAERYRDDRSRQSRPIDYTKHPATWLNSECWIEAQPDANPNGANGNGGGYGYSNSPWDN